MGVCTFEADAADDVIIDGALLASQNMALLDAARERSDRA